MPFKSEKQRRYLFANEPEIAKKWSKEYNMGGVASMFRKRLADGDDPFYDAWKKVYETNPDAASMNEKHDEYLEKYTLEMSTQTSEAPTEDVEQTADPMLNLFSETDALNNDQALTTLFAKEEPQGIMTAANGGNATKNIKGQPHMLAYITPKEANKLVALGGQETMTPEGIPAYPEFDNYTESSLAGTSSAGSGMSRSEFEGSSSGNNSGGDQEDDVAQMESDMGVTTNNAPDYTGSDYGFVVSEDDQTQLGGSDYIGPKDRIRINQDIINRKNKYDSFTQSAIRGVKTVGSFMSISNPFSFAKFVYDQNKKKNERIQEINADLALLDKIEATKYTPHTDTIYQMLEQEKLDLTQPRSRDDNNDNDGPEEIIAPIPVINEINEEFIDFNLMSALDKIRANQARRSGLVANEIIQDNNQIMTANKGGLAGLFKVKTQ